MIICPECRQETYMRVEGICEPIIMYDFDPPIETERRIATHVICRACFKTWGIDEFPMLLCEELNRKETK